MDIKQLKQYAKEKYFVTKLLSNGSTNTKTAKNDIDTFIMYLSPYTQNAKGVNLCPHASKGCISACLFTAGRGKFNNVMKARTNKANFYAYDRKLFLSLLSHEIKAIVSKYKKTGKKVAFRLNGTSDVDFLYLLNKYTDFDYLETPKNVYFYDYTKVIQRAIRYKNCKKYTLTFSKSESNQLDVLKAFKEGINVAAVFANELPKKYKSLNVVDGDKSDLEMLKYKGIILGLKAKGDAKKDRTGFVITDY